MNIIEQIEKEQARETPLPDAKPGDTVRVHYRVREGQRERGQVFEGTVIMIKRGNSGRYTITVRRVSGGVGTERVFPSDSPHIEQIEVVRRGKTRRARLYYLRSRIGKKAKVREVRRNVDDATAQAQKDARRARRTERRQARKDKRAAKAAAAGAKNEA